MSNALRDKFKADKRVVKLLSTLQTNSMNLGQLQRELLTLNQTRELRALNTKKILRGRAAVLTEVAISEAQTRARCTEIRVMILTEKMARDKVLSTIRKFLMAKYSDAMSNANMKTITAQKGFIDVFLDRYTSISTEMETVLTIAELISDDTKQASWNIKTISEVLSDQGKERYDD